VASSPTNSCPRNRQEAFRQPSPSSLCPSVQSTAILRIYRTRSGHSAGISIFCGTHSTLRTCTAPTLFSWLGRLLSLRLPFIQPAAPTGSCSLHFPPSLHSVVAWCCHYHLRQGLLSDGFGSNFHCTPKHTPHTPASPAARALTHYHSLHCLVLFHTFLLPLRPCAGMCTAGTPPWFGPVSLLLPSPQPLDVHEQYLALPGITSPPAPGCTRHCWYTTRVHLPYYLMHDLPRCAHHPPAAFVLPGFWFPLRHRPLCTPACARTPLTLLPASTTLPHLFENILRWVHI